MTGRVAVRCFRRLANRSKPRTTHPGPNSSERVPRMGARFAGSQRLGDRRRRRLAVESDEVPGPANVGVGLPGPTENSRVGHRAHIDHPSGAGTHTLSLPISAVVPSQWWKYLIGATVCLAMAACVIFAGVCAAKWPHGAGNAIISLFAFPEAKIATWFSSLLLTLSSQLALLIWWVRSQSLNDFDGRYRLWIRVASLWMALSLGMATDAARVLQETFVHVCGGAAAGYSFLGWLIPAVAGLWIVWAAAGGDGRLSLEPVAAVGGGSSVTAPGRGAVLRVARGGRRGAPRGDVRRIPFNRACEHLPQHVDSRPACRSLYF